MALTIHSSSRGDADAAIGVLRSSIAVLCVADHKNDADALSDWLANKAVESWCAWVGRDGAVVLVAEQDGRIAGVGMIGADGEVLLNYVHPDFRFTGVSKKLLEALEMKARDIGVGQCFLESTETALRFYTQRGYHALGDDLLFLEKVLEPF